MSRRKDTNTCHLTIRPRSTSSSRDARCVAAVSVIFVGRRTPAGRAFRLSRPRQRNRRSASRCRSDGGGGRFDARKIDSFRRQCKSSPARQGRRGEGRLSMPGHGEGFYPFGRRVCYLVDDWVGAQNRL